MSKIIFITAPLKPSFKKGKEAYYFLLLKAMRQTYDVNAGLKYRFTKYTTILM